MRHRGFRDQPTDQTTFYPRLIGTEGAVAANSYLSVNAGADVLKAGGNAVDAAATMAFVEGVVNPQMHTLGGECPMLLRLAGSDRVVSVNGNMAAPRRATPEEFARRGLRDVPDEGVMAAGVPAAFGALITAISRFGRMGFADVVGPAKRLASAGFAASVGLCKQYKFGLSDLVPRFETWPASRQLYTPGGRAPEPGDLLRNDALAKTFDWLENVERRSTGDRPARLEAVRKAFYEGEVAQAIDAFVRERDGLLDRSDLASFETKLEAPTQFTFGDATVFKCGFWSQGPALLQALAILRPFDLLGMGHNSAEYLHVVAEAMKLAFADREQYYGDPDQVDVPAEALLSAEYGRLRSELIRPDRASNELRPGNAARMGAILPAEERFVPQPWGHGTVHVDAVDRDGNMASLTPSGGWLRSSEVIGPLGFALSVRMMTFYLGPRSHPNVIAPMKRPRTTLTPSIALWRGSSASPRSMTFGTMGGDQQDQWQLQFFLNRAVFGMTMQQAIEAPKMSSEHFPGFFAPHDYALRRLRIEPRVGEPVLAELRRRGHDVDVAPDWSEGFVSGVERDEATGRLEAGVDPRGSKSEVFPSFALAW
jgi:gamma-glutamyltranspeptidase/glutathione hydrolase